MEPPNLLGEIIPEREEPPNKCFQNAAVWSQKTDFGKGLFISLDYRHQGKTRYVTIALPLGNTHHRTPKGNVAGEVISELFHRGQREINHASGESPTVQEEREEAISCD